MLLNPSLRFGLVILLNPSLRFGLVMLLNPSLRFGLVMLLTRTLCETRRADDAHPTIPDAQPCPILIQQHRRKFARLGAPIDRQPRVGFCTTFDHAENSIFSGQTVRF